MNNVLLTGGAGYIGSITTQMLIELGFNVIVIDNLVEGNKKAVNKEAKLIIGNYGDSDVLNKIFSQNRIDAVLHFAASANVPDSVANPLDYYQNNVANLITLLKTMGYYGVKNIIFSSTAAVYGEPNFIPIVEDHPTLPVNPYGYSKLFCERIIKDFSKSVDKFRYINFRYFCAAGATKKQGESRLKETHLIPLIIDCLLDNKKTLNVFGSSFPTIDGSGVRDYVHVVDIASAHILALRNLNKIYNREFNLGTNSGYSVLQLKSLSEKIFKRKIKYQIVDPRPGDPAVLVASNLSFFKSYNYLPRYDIKGILKSAYLWRKNPLY